jgi:hypothetical protein
LHISSFMRRLQDKDNPDPYKGTDFPTPRCVALTARILISGS